MHPELPSQEQEQQSEQPAQPEESTQPDLTEHGTNPGRAHPEPDDKPAP